MLFQVVKMNPVARKKRVMFDSPGDELFVWARGTFSGDVAAEEKGRDTTSILVSYGDSEHKDTMIWSPVHLDAVHVISETCDE